jgi:UDP-N-acetylmuramyl pentapeptide phosphotransferase/UDP-N-acetylglucosamine-1-phosphate transferase
MVIWLPADAFMEVRYLFMALSLIFITGLRDDLVPLPASIKLAGQIIPACIMIYWGGVELNSLYGFGSSTLFPGIITWMLSLFTIVVITNSFNLIDGLDGLAGTISLIILLAFGTWFYLLDHLVLSYVAFTCIGGVLAFLLFNWQPSRIFMGDTGALILGFLITCLAIFFININYALPTGHAYKFTATVSTCIAVMIIPLLDTMRVFIIRVSQGRSPFEADKNHLHHELIRLGMQHSTAVLILGMANLSFILLVILGKSLGDGILFGLIGSLVAVYLIILKILSIRSTRKALALKSEAQKAAV